MVAINTVFLVESNYIPCMISIFIFVIISLILINKSQKHDVICIMERYIICTLYKIL